MSEDLHQKCSELIQELKLGSAQDIVRVKPLNGGVSSDIAKVQLEDRTLCIKFALPKLKVSADWKAPVHRNRAEYEWLKFAAGISSQSAIKLYGRSERLHGFAMEFLEGDSVYLWKSALLNERTTWTEAKYVGDLMGRIHAASARDSFNAANFQNQNDFYALRLEPYLIYTAEQHPTLAAPLRSLSDDLYKADHVLVHGDISPKNILLRDGTPIMLDAECATMGDASFDLAFCLNHLMLKAVHLPNTHQQLLESAISLWEAYQRHIHWERTCVLESRVCRLLPALMLGRVDGKSPVEYLDADNQSLVRNISSSLIQSPKTTLSDLIKTIKSEL